MGFPESKEPINLRASAFPTESLPLITAVSLSEGSSGHSNVHRERGRQVLRYVVLQDKCIHAGMVWNQCGVRRCERYPGPVKRSRVVIPSPDVRYKPEMFTWMRAI